MKVTPKTENEIASANLLPKGWYPCTITEAEEKVSKKGNEMIELNVKVYRPTGGFNFVRDFLMDNEASAAGLRHCADMCGCLSDYEAGAIKPELWIDREGWVKIGIEKGKDNYPDKNRIYDYAKEDPTAKKPAATTAAKPSENPDEDPDMIPF